MSNQTTESNNNQINNKKEEERNKILQEQQQKGKTEKIAENTIEVTTSINSNTTNAVTTIKISGHQKIDKAIFNKSIDITNRYQQQINKAIKATTENYYQLQKNILNTYQSTFSKFINDTSDSNKSYNFAVLEQLKFYNKINQNMIDSTINSTRTIHEFFAEYTDIFNKSIELGQEYYSDRFKNYFNISKKSERT
jgi:hypothetical protein